MQQSDLPDRATKSPRNGRSTTLLSQTFMTHLDGFNQMGLLTNGEPTAHGVFYSFTDRGDLAGVRYDRWKVVLMRQIRHLIEMLSVPSN